MIATLLRTLRHFAFIVICLVIFAAIPPLIRWWDPTSSAPYDMGFLQRPFVALFAFAVMLAGVWMLIQLGFTTFRRWFNDKQPNGPAVEGEKPRELGGFERAWETLNERERAFAFLGLFLVLCTLYVIILCSTPV